MLIVVCGMHRSGSTLVWQIARALLEGHPGLRNPRGIATSEFPGAASDPDDLLMAKVHFRGALNREDFPDDGVRYLYTYRDPRDVVASMYRKARHKPGTAGRGAETSRLITRREIRGDQFWTSKKDVWIGRYEDFATNTHDLVLSVAGYLNVSVDQERLVDIVREVDVHSQHIRARSALTDGIDDDLRVTSNHITDGRAGAWRETLTREEAVAVETEAAAWMHSRGYNLESRQGMDSLVASRHRPWRPIRWARTRILRSR